ncbi:hypothetical protein JCM10449v2_005921 [Rhodotorula kratochvilovae]
MPSSLLDRRATPAHPSPSPSLAASQRDNDARQLRWGDAQVVNTAPNTNTRADNASDGDHAEGEEDCLEEQGSVLAITATKGKIGCCFFDPTKDKLFFLEDQNDSAAWDLTHLKQLLPANVLTSSTADSSFLDALDTKLASLPLPPSASSAASSTDTNDGKIRLEYRPAREFYAGQGKHALSQLHVTEGGWYAEVEEESEAFDSEHPDVQGGGFDGIDNLRDAYDFGGRPNKRRRVAHVDMDGEAMRRNHELRIEAFLNSLCASPITVGCAGALLNHVQKSRSGAGDLDGAFEVRGLELMQLDKVMLINSDALASLQVFQDEAHAATGSTATKEGLVNITRTPLGKILLRQWFLRPSLELGVIEARHDAVECFRRDVNQAPIDAIQSQFKHVKNIPRVLKALAGGTASLKDWQAVWTFLYASMLIRDAVLCLENRRGVEVLETLLDSFDSVAFKGLGEMVNDVIDWEESQLKQGKVCVRPGIDAELDALRRTYDGLPNLLSSIAKDLARDLPYQLADELSLVYFPQLGYLIAIAYEPDVTDAGKYGTIGWDYQFVTEQQAYFKNDKCRDLDRHLGDLQCFISDKEIEIIHALVAHVLQLRDQLLAVADVLAELDCLIAFAEASRLYDWHRPTMTEDPVCKILKGRHPLAELCVETFVPNNTSLYADGYHVMSGRKVGGLGAVVDEADRDVKPEVADEKSMIILTGANFSGKSVYLKQVALITFMAHIGCFVPAEEALIGLTDRIMTRVSTRESITRGASAFMIDLQQISFALRNLTPRSLLILDEFGKGTEANDGAGLFCGVVEHLVALGREMPRVCVATHFQRALLALSLSLSVCALMRGRADVFLNGLLSRQLPAIIAHMEILVDQTSSTSFSGGASGSGTETNVERIAYLLAPGLALSSHATALASLFGLAPAVLRRAEEVSRAVATFTLDGLAVRSVEELGEGERRELEEAEQVGRRLVGMEMSGEEGVEGLKKLLRWVLEGDEELA